MTNINTTFTATIDEISRAFLGGKIDRATAEKRFTELLKKKEDETAAKVKANAREIKLTKTAKEAASALADYIIVLTEEIAPIDPKDKAEMINLIFEALMEFKSPFNGAKSLKDTLDKIDVEKEASGNEIDWKAIEKLMRSFGATTNPQKVEKKSSKTRDAEKIFEDFFKSF